MLGDARLEGRNVRAVGATDHRKLEFEELGGGLGVNGHQPSVLLTFAQV